MLCCSQGGLFLWHALWPRVPKALGHVSHASPEMRGHACDCLSILRKKMKILVRSMILLPEYTCIDVETARDFPFEADFHALARD